MDVKKSTYSVDDLTKKVGESLGVSDWLEVTQDNINQFAAVTFDDYWIHTDPERVSNEGIFDTTIAHGFWTLSLLTYFNNQMGIWPSDTVSGLNYGLNKVRWMSPIPIGSRIRNHVVLKDLRKRGHNRFIATYLCTIEVEDTEKPAMVAEWLGMILTEPV